MPNFYENHLWKSHLGKKLVGHLKHLCCQMWPSGQCLEIVVLELCYLQLHYRYKLKAVFWQNSIFLQGYIECIASSSGLLSKSDGHTLFGNIEDVFIFHRWKFWPNYIFLMFVFMILICQIIFYLRIHLKIGNHLFYLVNVYVVACTSWHQMSFTVEIAFPPEYCVTDFS